MEEKDNFKEEIKEIKKIESIEEIFEDKTGSLIERVDLIEEYEEVDFDIFLEKGNVSFGKFAISPVTDLENLPVVHLDEEEDEDMIEYNLMKNENAKYQSRTELYIPNKDPRSLSDEESLLAEQRNLNKRIENINSELAMAHKNIRDEYISKTYSVEESSKEHVEKVGNMFKKMSDDYQNPKF